MGEARVAAGGVSRDPKLPPQSVRIVVQLFDCRAERLFGNDHASRWRHDDPLWSDQSTCQVRSMSFEVCNRREELRLYDRKRDRYERRNVAHRHPKKVRELWGRILRDAGGKLPRFRNVGGEG